MLSDFIQTHTVTNLGGTIPAATLFHKFREQLPENERGDWPRLRCITETTKAGLELALDTSGATVIVGRSMKRKRQTTVRAGRLVRI
jgi:hypothetical protein